MSCWSWNVFSIYSYSFTTTTTRGILLDRRRQRENARRSEIRRCCCTTTRHSHGSYWRAEPRHAIPRIAHCAFFFFIVFVVVVGAIPTPALAKVSTRVTTLSRERARARPYIYYNAIETRCARRAQCLILMILPRGIFALFFFFFMSLRNFWLWMDKSDFIIIFIEGERDNKKVILQLINSQKRGLKNLFLRNDEFLNNKIFW